MKGLVLCVGLFLVCKTEIILDQPLIFGIIRDDSVEFDSVWNILNFLFIILHGKSIA